MTFLHACTAHAAGCGVCGNGAAALLLPALEARDLQSATRCGHLLHSYIHICAHTAAAAFATAAATNQYIGRRNLDNVARAAVTAAAVHCSMLPYMFL